MKDKKLTNRAKNLRKNLTPEEKQLWRLLRGRRFLDYKFRRQVPIDKYIVDFCCLKKRLIIELDGAHHRKPKNLKYYRNRSSYLRNQGFKLLRLWNSELSDIETVKDKILKYLED